MSKLEELIAEYCPDGVAFRRIGDCCLLEKGRTPIQKAIPGDYPLVVTTSERKSADSFQFDRPGVCIPLVSSRGHGVASLTEVFYQEGKFAVGNILCCVIPKDEDELSAKFLHLFLNYAKDYLLVPQMKGGANVSLSVDAIARTKIPVPPLPVQREIVRILDNFTELTSELTSELTARKKQYEYYRDSLLAFDDDVPMVKLENIATEIYRGAGIKRDEVTPDGIPCVRYGEIYTSYDISFTECISHTQESVVSTPKYFGHGDIIFTITGESVDEIAKSIAYLGNEKCMAGGDTVVMKHNQEPRYISYALSTTAAQAQKSKGKVKSKVVHSSVPALKEIVIPLPEITVQKRIADLLDSFHYLCNDISSGIPAEIEARQKQYEYYRDKLLTFKEKE